MYCIFLAFLILYCAFCSTELATTCGRVLCWILWLVPTKILQQGETVRQCLLNICRTYDSLEVTDDDATISIETRMIGIKLRRSKQLMAIAVNWYI
jgi:hypothetical protein